MLNTLTKISMCLVISFSVDVDECMTGVHGCDQNANCTNTVGSHNCTCEDGLYGDGKQCDREYRLVHKVQDFARFFEAWKTRMLLKVSLRQDPPWFEFLVIFDFFAPWYRRGREASSVKICLKNSKEKLVKCATEGSRLHMVSIQSCTQNRPSPKVQSLSRDWI